MTNNIGRIFGGSNYGVGGYVPQQKNNNEENVKEQPQQNAQLNETQVDPNKVMEFLANNNYFVEPAKTETAEIDVETEERITDSMAKFEAIYAVVEQEFGRENAPMVMDLIMDVLMDKLVA